MRKSRCLPLTLAVWAGMTALLTSCSSKDDPDLPSRGITVEQILPKRPFDPVRDDGKFDPRFFVIYCPSPPKGGPPITPEEDVAHCDTANKTLENQLSFFFLRKFVAKTIEGARTVVLVTTSHEVVGRYVTGLTDEEAGSASVLYVTICLVDLRNSARRHVMTASSSPPQSIQGGNTSGGLDIIDGVEHPEGGRHGYGLLLQALLEKVVDK